jgi:hypothetical protein
VYLSVFFKEVKPARCQWLTPVILATQEAEIRRIVNQSQSQANSLRNPISKKSIQNRAGGVAQVVVWLPSKCKTLSSSPITTKKKEVKSHRKRLLAEMV